MRTSLIFLMVFFSTQAQAQSEITPITQKVIVNGSQTDAEESRDFVAGKIIIGKQRIAESGVQNVGEILRREPAISIGRDGRIGLLGLAGYTQVLVDGAPPHGPDVFGIDLVHVERIEIIKSTTAVTGPVGIAGTINIVRRKTERKAFTQLRVGGSSTGNRGGADLAWSTNQTLSIIPLSYNLSFAASHKATPSRSHYFQTRDVAASNPAQEFDGELSAPSQLQLLTVGSEFTLALNTNHKLRFSPDGGRFNQPQDSLEQRRWSDGSQLFAQERNRNSMSSYSMPLSWDWQIDPRSNLVVKLNMNHYRMEADSFRSEIWPQGGLQLRRHSQSRVVSNHFLNVDFNTEFDGGHEITAGAKLVRNSIARTYADLANGVPNLSLAVLGTESAIQFNSKQLFGQYEYRLNTTLALNLGGSFERRDYQLNEGPIRNRVNFNMWSPSIHLSKKVNGNNKRKVRVALARSFQPPTPDQMLIRPSINPFAPCQDNKLCAANSIDSADSTGNSNLQPERALGLNLSYAHGIGEDSDLLMEFYSRDIKNKIGHELVLGDVAWASTQRYLLRPANLGQAKVLGVNLEGRLSSKDISKDFSNFELHGSIGFARSELSDLPGPNNRIAEQSPWRAKFGGSYTIQSAPLKLGFETNLLPAGWVRSNLSQRVHQSSQFTMGVNASWKFSANSRLTLNIDNLLPRKNRKIDEYQSLDGLYLRTTNNSSYSRFVIRLETMLQ
jgi:outer membrane receptor for ferrienterochelin and colicins